jgi:hypothetical protein
MDLERPGWIGLSYDRGALGYDAMFLNKVFPTFRRNLTSASSSEVKDIQPNLTTHEDEGNTFVQRVGSRSSNNTASYPIRKTPRNKAMRRQS